MASRNKKRLNRKAMVAPAVEAKLTTITPRRRPKYQPYTSVNTDAPGKESPVTTTYTQKGCAVNEHGMVFLKRTQLRLLLGKIRQGQRVAELQVSYQNNSTDE